MIGPAKRIRDQIREYLQPVVLNWVSNAVYTHDSALRMVAILEGVDYAKTHMQGATRLSDKIDVLLEGVKLAPKTGLWAEFGVWRGNTINVIADHVGNQTTVHGFDSFEGLPEDWQGRYREGEFHMNGALPKVRPNVVLHKGWFDETVPKFAAEHPDEPVALLHIDCDLYSSTKVIFGSLGDRLRPGSVIVFDEYFNYAGWREHEYKAFQELLLARSLRYRYVAYNDSEMNVTVQITE
jgi:Macrocin-O-methyltransferase (TylF)